MKNLVNIGLIALGAYVVYNLMKKDKRPIATTQSGAMTPTGGIKHQKPVTLNGLINGIGKKRLMTESQCAERAKSVRFGSAQEKYEWIVACMQTYSGAHGGCASCDGDNTRWVAVQ